MHMKVFLPQGIYLDEKVVTRVVCETDQGLFGILPNRLDCVGALAAGILIYDTPENGENYVAIDRGILVKAEDEIMISVRSAIGGKELGKLNEAVQKEFLDLNEKEIEIRSAMMKLETGFYQTISKNTRRLNEGRKPTEQSSRSN